MQIIPFGTKFAVQTDEGVTLKGRFHTPDQANDWILQQKVASVLAIIHGTNVHPHNGRPMRFEVKLPNVYRENLLNEPK